MATVSTKYLKKFVSFTASYKHCAQKIDLLNRANRANSEHSACTSFYLGATAYPRRRSLAHWHKKGMGKMFLLSDTPTLKDAKLLERKLIGHYQLKQLNSKVAKCALLNASNGGEGLTRQNNFIYYLT